MAEPSYEELQQRVEDLEKLVKPYYETPGGDEYSFPVERQGITQDQFQQMFLGIGDGIIHRGRLPYILEKHDSDAETNERNTLILRVDKNLGYSESAIAGFYHRMSDDVELEFPPVTTNTDYYVCITYDPRNFRVPSGPISLKVYDGEPPESDGQMHVVLNVVKRRPNQLLSQAEIQRYRQFISPTISVQYVEQLPSSHDVLFGTVAFVGVAGTSTFDLYTTSGGGWRNMLFGDWEDCAVNSSWATDGQTVQARWSPMGVQLKGRLSSDGRTGNTRPMFTLPERMGVSRSFRTPAWATGSDPNRMLTVSSTGNGRDVYVSGGTRPGYVEVNNIVIPFHVLKRAK